MKEKLTIVKVGGAVVEDELQLTQLLKDFAAIPGKKVLVHGGGRRATKVAAALGIETKMVEGRRITDAPMLEVVTMVYGGLVNKNLVAKLQAAGINALGLTGADANVLQAHKRPPVEIPGTAPATQCSSPSPCSVGRANSATPPSSLVDFGFVGDVDQANSSVLADFIGRGITPVIAPLTHDGQGHLLNTNADTIASETAKALASIFDVTLLYCFEKAGVLTNPDDEASVIPSLTRAIYNRYRADGTISGGMIPKIENALAAVEAGVERVIITKATAIDGAHGTVITK